MQDYKKFHKFKWGNPSNRPLQKGMITIETDQFDCFLGLKLIKEKNEFHCFLRCL